MNGVNKYVHYFRPVELCPLWPFEILLAVFELRTIVERWFIPFHDLCCFLSRPYDVVQTVELIMFIEQAVVKLVTIDPQHPHQRCLDAPFHDIGIRTLFR